MFILKYKIVLFNQISIGWIVFCQYFVNCFKNWQFSRCFNIIVNVNIGEFRKYNISCLYDFKI